MLTVDALGKLISYAAEMGILQALHPRRAIPVVSLYADDVVMFCHPMPSDTAAIKSILDLFGKSSGLQVNYSKSSATLLNGEPDDAEIIRDTLGCQIAELPLTYLGIPLMLRRPTSAQLQPLVNKMAGKLPTWKSWLMNKPGRLAMVKSVLSAIPIHQIMVLDPSKKILKMFDKVERGFLWEGCAQTNGGSCHVNWRTVCRPLSLGGLGVQDMDLVGLALRARWLWYSKTDESRAWSGLDMQFGTREQSLFFASTYLIVGNGHTGKFWEDRWLNGRSVREFAPQLYACVPKRRRKGRTIADGLNANNWACDIQGTVGIDELGQYLNLWRLIAATLFTLRPRARIDATSAHGMPLLEAGLARDARLATHTLQATTGRTITLRLVDHSKKHHSQAHAQGTRICHAAGRMDDLEAPKLLCFRQRAPFSPASSERNTSRSGPLG